MNTGQPHNLSPVVPGEKFGRLTVLRMVRPHKWGHVQVFCRCDCGAFVIKLFRLLRTGQTPSCGCAVVDYRRIQCGWITHGQSKIGSGTYSSWKGMRERCLQGFKPSYGGSGITICDRWLKFENFFSDMGERPPGLSINRLRNDLGYSKRNCEWATFATQNRNRTNVRKIAYAGEVKGIVQWAETLGVKYVTFYPRLKKAGWDLGRYVAKHGDGREPQS